MSTIGLERGVEQDLERGIGRGPVLVGDLVAGTVGTRARPTGGDWLSSHGP